MPSESEVQRAKAELLPLDAVTLVGETDESIIVYLAYDDPDAAEHAHTVVDAPVEVHITGDVEAAHTDLYAGMSYESFFLCTVGFIAHKHGEPYLVTAYHCVRDLAVGDPVTTGGGTIGYVAATPEVDEDPVTGVDVHLDCDYAAIQITSGTPLRKTERLGKPVEGDVHVPRMGETMVKSGRTTGLSRGNVYVKNASATAPADISGFGVSATVDNLTGITTTVEPGDSGGPVVAEYDDHVRPAGLVYGGVPGSTMFFSELDYVKAQTGLRFDGELPEPSGQGFIGEIEGPGEGGWSGFSPNVTYLSLAGLGVVGAFAYTRGRDRFR